jgi:hypothetical protein
LASARFYEGNDRFSRGGVVRSFFRALAIASTLTASALAGCSSNSTSEDVHVERFKELLVVDNAVVNDQRASNETDGPWSFRHLVEQFVADGADPGDTILRWLQDWGSMTEINGYSLEASQTPVDRTAAMNAVIICPWLQRSPANACDATCTKCAAKKLDLAKAPFRLLAIVNRMDLRDKVYAKSKAGEARFVFGLTAGPADDPASEGRPMTLIFEYALPASRTAVAWAADWHELGTFDAFDETYLAKLESLTNKFASRGASPEFPNGSALSQVRTNESALHWVWQLREFTLATDGIHQGLTLNTPFVKVNGTTQLESFLKQNAAAIQAENFVFPNQLLGGSVSAKEFHWTTPNVDDGLRKAFALQTCNGCHATENGIAELEALPFHISPTATAGLPRVSKFMHNPASPTTDELSKREKSLAALLR